MTKKVIILGAGASYDYGFPTGEGLINEISIILKSCSAPRLEAYNKFKAHFLKFKPKSIDEYLSGTKDTDVQKIGKKLILFIIKNNENIRHFSVPKKNPDSKEKSPWYNYLTELFFPIYYGDENKGYEEFIKNLKNTDIITFNYDVSLEYFLFSQIERGYFQQQTLKNSAKKEIINRIHHVYGQVWENTVITEKYGTLHKTDWDDAHNFIGNFLEKEEPNLISVIGEERAMEKFEKAQSNIYNANELYLLGFGFDSINCRDVLGLDKFIEKHTPDICKIFCTNFGGIPKITNKINTYFPAKNQKTYISDKDMINTMKNEFDFDNEHIPNGKRHAGFIQH